jgi:hypothetical protein
MHIDGLEFGTITIAGQTFSTDVLIFPDGSVKDHWWRARGHVLSRKDLAPLLAAGSREIVVGTGIYGRMRPVPGLVSGLEAEGVRLTILANVEAMQKYNQRMKEGGPGQGLAACFHLTC